MPDGLAILGVGLGIISYTSLYLGKGIQKRGVEGLKVDKKVKSRHSAIWLIGTVLTATPTFLQWAALIFAPINLIAPLEGVGLIVLFAYSAFVLKEQVRRQDAIGVALIVVGIVGIAVFSSESPPPALKVVRFDRFWLILGVTTGVPLLGVALFWRRRPLWAGILWGLVSGVMMAFQTAAKRLSLLPDIRLAMVALTFTFATLTLATTQLGFIKAGASRVVPAFTTASVPLAAFLGFAVLGENIPTLSAAGIGFVVVGMLLIAVGTRRRAPNSGGGTKTSLSGASGG